MCRENERTHKHHIIPRYMGGTDAAENLVEVTVTQHAMFHFCNFRLWNNEQDRIAWRMLSGQITADEAKIEAMKLGSKKGIEALKEKFKDPENLREHKEKCKQAFHNSPYKEEAIERCIINQPKAVEAARTPEAIEKKTNTFKERGHLKGEKNPQYGTMWITDGTVEGSYRIKKGDPIPEGFRPGAVFLEEYPCGENTSNYGKIFITDGNHSYLIPKDEPIPEGYYRGRENKFMDNIDREQCSKNGKYLYENKLGSHAQTTEERKELASKGGKNSSSQRWMCLETGHVCNAGPLTTYQKNRGIDTSRRIRIK